MRAFMPGRSTKFYFVTAVIVAALVRQLLFCSEFALLGCSITRTARFIRRLGVKFNFKVNFYLAFFACVYCRFLESLIAVFRLLDA